MTKIVGGRGVAFRPLAPSLTFGVNDDWNIEAGAVGDQFLMKVWRVGDPEPESPQLAFTDRSFSTGSFSIETTIDGGFRNPARISASFDDIYIVFPEVGNSLKLDP